MAERELRADKVWEDAGEAIGAVRDGDTILIGGFGEIGVPLPLVEALLDAGPTDLTIVANNAGGSEGGIADLLAAGRVRKMICSFPRGDVFATLYAQKAVKLELVPQGTLAERIRAGGAGIGPFYCPVGVGTSIAEGKEQRGFGDREYVLEHPLRGDVALIKAHQADRFGNLAYRASARNFNPIMAMAAALTIAQVSELRPAASYLEPEQVITPGIFVDRLVASPEEELR
jgi:3-oxoadipate CoA-transferase, alpha subunit